MARKYRCSALPTESLSYRSSQRRTSNASATTTQVPTRAGWAPTRPCRGLLRTWSMKSYERFAADDRRDGASRYTVCRVALRRPALTSRGTSRYRVQRDLSETQVVLASLKTPLAGVQYAAAVGELASLPPLEWYRRRCGDCGGRC